MNSRAVGRKATPAPLTPLPSLDLDSLRDDTDTALRARGTALTREYAAVEGKATTLLKNLATVVIAIRERHQDMRGDSQAYRDEVSEMYRNAGIPADALERAQRAVRWHVGNLLRDRLDVAELEALQLKPTKPIERTQAHRESTRALVAAARVSEAASPKKPSKKSASTELVAAADVKATADHLRLASAATRVLGQLRSDVIDTDMTDGQRSRLDAELAEAQRVIAALRRHTRRTSGKG